MDIVEKVNEIRARRCSVLSVLENNEHEDAEEEKQLVAEINYLDGELSRLESRLPVCVTLKSPIPCIISVKDENVDGCGGSADMLLALNAKPTQAAVVAFQAALAKAKGRNECLDTEDMIALAGDAVFGHGEWKFLSQMTSIIEVGF